MSLFKSTLITCGIFVLIGLGCWASIFLEQEKQADKTLALAKDLYQKGNYQEAIDKIGNDLPLRKREDFLFIKFESLMELGRFYEAETVSQELLKLNSKNDKYYYLIGLLHYNNGNLPKSVESFQKATELQPKNIDYKLNLARVLSQNGNNSEAIKIYQQIMKADPRYEVAWAEMAGIYDLQGNKKEVLRLREDAAKRFSNNSYDQYMLGVIYDELKMKDKAVKFLKKALVLQPDMDNDAKQRIEKLTGKPYYVVTGQQEKIPLHGLGNLLIADAKINNTGGKFLIDTGASSSVLYERFLKKNNIQVETSAYGVLKMANGQTSFAPSTYVDLKFGRHILSDIKVYILPDNKEINLDGIIGMDVLNNYNIQLDKNSEALIITR